MYKFIALCLSFVCCFGVGFNVYANEDVLTSISESNN